MCHLLPSLFHNILIDPQIQMTETQKNSTEMISCKGQIVVLKLKRESRENDHDKKKKETKIENIFISIENFSILTI
jgi:hypothetical protein